MEKVKFVAGRDIDDIKNFLSDAPTVIIDIGFGSGRSSELIFCDKDLLSCDFNNPIFCVDLRKQFLSKIEKMGDSYNLTLKTYSNQKWCGFGEIIETLKALLILKPKLNIIIEAPLSGKFSSNGNPMKRGDFEYKKNNDDKIEKSHRYWYEQAALPALVATGNLLRELASWVKRVKNKNKEISCYEIRFFEGFLSFKKSGDQSDHRGDVKKLLRAVQAIASDSKQIKIDGEEYEVAYESVKTNDGEKVINIFHMFGIDKFNDIIEVPAAHEAPLVIVIKNK